MRIEVSDAARRDLVAAFDYLAERSPKAALATRSAIRKAVLSLRKFPNRGRQGEMPGARELAVRGTSYVIVYSTSDSEVLVARIRHTRQDPAP